jgi:hypothetical protein
MKVWTCPADGFETNWQYLAEKHEDDTGHDLQVVYRETEEH